MTTCAATGARSDRSFGGTRERESQDHRSVEVIYGWTSLLPQRCSPQRLLQVIRAHWAVENRLHWLREVTLREDASQVRTAHVPEILALLNSAILST
jgi:predicted transposase YbfD/YdcC